MTNLLPLEIIFLEKIDKISFCLKEVIKNEYLSLITSCLKEKLLLKTKETYQQV